MLRWLATLRRGRHDLVAEALDRLRRSGSTLAPHEAEYLVRTTFNAYLIALSQGDRHHFEEAMAAIADREARAGNALRVEAVVVGLDATEALVRALDDLPLDGHGAVDPADLVDTGRACFLRVFLRAKALEDERRAAALESYAEAAEDVPSIIYSTDVEGRITDINHLAAELLGYRKEELLGRHHSILMRPEDAARHSHFIQERRTDDRATRRERVTLRAADGGLREFEVSSTGVYDTTGRYVGSDGIARAVSGEVVQLEYQLDAAGRFVAISEPAAAVLGFRPEELLGQHFAAIMEPGERERVGRVFGERRTDERAARSIRVVLTGRDGARREFEISAVGRYDDAGSFVGTVGLGSDITSRSELEQAVAESRRKYRTMFDQAGLGLSVISSDLVVRESNAWHHRRRRRSLAGTRCYVGLFGNAEPCSWCGLQEAMERGETVIREEVVSALDGRRYTLVFSPVSDSEDRAYGVLETVIDVTREREQRERAYLDDKHAALARLASGLAAPLDVRLTVVALRAAAADQAAVRVAAEEALRPVRQLGRFCGQRGGAGAAASDLNALIAAALPQVAAVSPAIDVDADLLPTLPPAALAADEAAELVERLIQNAVDAMPDGGILTIETAGDPDSGLTLRITDSGEGLTEADLRRAPDPFFTTRSGHDGLGLSHCVGLARQAGGRVDLTSAPGAGTTAEVWLPAALGPPGQTAHSRPAPGAAPATVAVELVSPELAEAVVAVLGWAGYRVVEPAAAEVRVTDPTRAGEAGATPRVILLRTGETAPAAPAGTRQVVLALPCSAAELLAAVALRWA